MATKRITKKAAPAAKKKTTKTATKKAPKEKVEVKQGPRHPKAKVSANHGGKEALAKALAPSLARGDEDTDVLAKRLTTASNTQLLRLQRLVETMKQKWGSREKLIAAITDSQKKGKDKDFVAKLESFPLPRLVDLATSAVRRARA
jgi:hypothetical protein